MGRRATPKPPRPTDDHVREAILEYMHAEYRRSRAVNPGRRKVSEIKAAMKVRGITQQEVARNLDYLVQTGWITREEERYPVIGGGRPVMATQPFFKISNKGIDYKEGPSKFQKVERYEGIDVAAIGSVVVVGGNNVVNASYADLYGALGILGESIKASDKLTEEQKLNAQADVETIKNQIVKSEPDRTIVQRAWEGLKTVATLEGVAAAAARVATVLRPLLGL